MVQTEQKGDQVGVLRKDTNRIVVSVHDMTHTHSSVVHRS